MQIAKLIRKSDRLVLQGTQTIIGRALHLALSLTATLLLGEFTNRKTKRRHHYEALIENRDPGF